MKIQFEPEDIDVISQKVVELLKPFLLLREEAKADLPASKPKGDYMTIPQLAKYLQISKAIIHSWIYQRKIPYSKIGRMVRFKREEIVRWSKERKVKARFYDKLNNGYLMPVFSTL